MFADADSDWHVDGGTSAPPRLEVGALTTPIFEPSESTDVEDSRVECAVFHDQPYIKMVWTHVALGTALTTPTSMASAASIAIDAATDSVISWDAQTTFGIPRHYENW